MDIFENTKRILDYFSDAANFRSSTIIASHRVSATLAIIIDPQPVTLKYGDVLPDDSVPIAVLADNGDLSPVAPEGSGINLASIRQATQENWDTATYTTIGHVDGLPNYTIGTFVVHVPDNVDVKTIQAAIDEFAALGTKNFISTYEV